VVLIPTWPQGASGPEKIGCECLDGIRQRRIGGLGPLAFGIAPQQHRRIVADALGDGVHRDARIEQGGRVDAPEVVKPGRAEAEPTQN